MARLIIAFSGCGATRIVSTMARIGLLVRAALADMATGVHAGPTARADDVDVDVEEDVEEEDAMLR